MTSDYQGRSKEQVERNEQACEWCSSSEAYAEYSQPDFSQDKVLSRLFSDGAGDG